MAAEGPGAPDKLDSKIGALNYHIKSYQATISGMLLQLEAINRDPNPDKKSKTSINNNIALIQKALDETKKLLTDLLELKAVFEKAPEKSQRPGPKT
jgi:hypothetical protein